MDTRAMSRRSYGTGSLFVSPSRIAACSLVSARSIGPFAAVQTL